MLRRVDHGPAELAAAAQHRASSGASRDFRRNGSRVRNERSFGAVKSLRGLLGETETARITGCALEADVANGLRLFLRNYRKAYDSIDDSTQRRIYLREFFFRTVGRSEK